MARLALTVKELPSLNAAMVANSADLAWVGGNAADGYKFASTGREVVLVRNTDDTDPQTFGVDSTPDSRLGRERDITAYSLAALEQAALGPFPMDGWRQADNTIYLAASDNAIEFAVIRVP